jgi:Tol biopolymer transport system component
VAFVRDWEVWTARIDGTNERQLTERSPTDPSSGDAEPAWSPDGRQIAFVHGAVSGWTTPAWFAGQQLFVVPASGGAAHPVTAASQAIRDLGTPAWSPDGSQLAYVSLTQQDLERRTASHLGSLHLVRVDSTNDHVLALPTSLGGAAQPAWSPDGTRLAFATCKGLGVMNADGTDIRLLTHARTCSPTLVGSDPAWAPDGTRIVFTRSGHFFGLENEFPPPTNLWTINPDGTGLTRLTDVPSYDTDPTWLP